MKKIILLVLILAYFTSFSQEVFTFKSGGGILQNGKLITPAEVRAQFNNNKNIIDLYDAGRTKKTLGNVLLYGGLITFIGKFVYDVNYSPKVTQKVTGSYNYGQYNNTAYFYSYESEPAPSRDLYYVAGAMILSAIPIKIGFSDKIRKAIALMNEDIKNPKTTSIDSTSFIANSNGIGLSITF